MKTIYASRGRPISLGQRGENDARRIAFDVADWPKLYGEGTVHLLAQRPGETTPYPAVIEVQDGVAYWPITDADTAIPGAGSCELQYRNDDGLVVKSQVYTTRTNRSLDDGAEEPPEAAQGWVDKVLSQGLNDSTSLEILSETDMILAVSDKDGAVLADENDNIIEW